MRVAGLSGSKWGGSTDEGSSYPVEWFSEVKSTDGCSHGPVEWLSAGVNIPHESVSEPVEWFSGGHLPMRVVLNQLSGLQGGEIYK